MKRLLSLTMLIMFIVLGITVAFAADSEYRFMHNDHDALVIGEITAIDGEKAVIRAADYIVSAKDLNVNDKKKQLRPETVTVDGMFGYDIMKSVKVGDYIIVSIAKAGNEFNVVNGAYPVDSLDYKTLKVTAYNEETAAAMTDFVNSGGAHTEFAFHSDTKVTRRNDDGTETVIYEKTAASEQATISPLPTQTADTEKPPVKDTTLIYYIIGAVLILIIVLIVLKRRNKG